MDLSLEQKIICQVKTKTRKRARIKIPVKGDDTGGIYTEEENTEYKTGETGATVI